MSKVLARLRRGSDDGAGMILVIGTAIMIATLVVTGITISMNGLTQSRNRQSYEQSLAAAENGIDWGLAKVQQAFDQYNRDYPVPSPPSIVDPAPQCDAPVVEYPASAPDGVFASEQEERNWARTELESLASVPGCLQRGGQGEFVVLKPPTPLVDGKFPKSGKIYALSWVASRDSSKATARLLKSEYVFMPYRPTHAVLTGGALMVDSSTTVQGAYGVDPTLASVHSNDVVSTSGNPTVYGPVTSTGASSASSNRFFGNTATGGAVTTSNLQAIPDVSARSLYFQALENDPTAVATYWYDLCPDGSVRPYSTSGPCTSGTALNATATTGVYTLPYLGWTFAAGSRTWAATRDAASGVWFAHESNVTTKNGPDPHFANFTVIASSENADDCALKRFGHIKWDHHSIKAPAYHNLWMYADGDIVTTSNFTAGSGTTSPPVISGMFVAGDQIQLETSSAGAVGSVVAADECVSPPPSPTGLITTNAVKNPTIWFDPDSDAPFTSRVTTTLWLDYSG